MFLFVEHLHDYLLPSCYRTLVWSASNLGSQSNCVFAKKTGRFGSKGSCAFNASSPPNPVPIYILVIDAPSVDTDIVSRVGIKNT